ncbi:MAG: RNA polymerase sigma-70 factor [Burkholderiales bacterium]|nr:RNA polymerase sigma-70 factor [Anaerolineae bacterium]
MTSETQTFESYRPLLFSIAYRMLGSAMEAEDMVQEAYLRYEKADEPIEYPKAYLTTIVTRLCLDHLKSAKTQREQYIGTWLPEPILTGGLTDLPGESMIQQESITLAFLVLLENLSPMERAIFVLRDVFDYRYAEIADIIGKNEANCRRYYHRAKQFLSERRPRFEPSSDEQTRLVEGFLHALTNGDVESLTDMLVEDAVFYGDGGGKVKAVGQPLIGQKAVIRFLTGIFRLYEPGMRVEISEVNGAPALLLWKDDKLYFVMSFNVVDGKFTDIRNMLNPDKLAFVEKQVLSSE